MTCAPNPHTMPRSSAFALRIACTTALKSAAASMSGSDAINPATDAGAGHGRAKSSTRALFWRDLSG